MRAKASAKWVMAAALTIAAPATAGPGDWDRASGIVRTGLAGFSLGVPALGSDWRGARQDAEALLLAGGVTVALKSTIHERRPDGSNDRSFPSGHTAIAFAAAAGLEQRYGWKAGAPAHLAAAFVGLARVEADKHYWHDVAVGAVIGEAAGLLLVHRRRQRQAAVPLAIGWQVAF